MAKKDGHPALGVAFSGGNVVLTLGPAPDAANPIPVIGAAAEKALGRLRQAPEGVTLLKQRALLEKSLGELAAAQAAVSGARANRAAALGRGDDPAGAEAELREALTGVDLLTERVAALRPAIRQSEAAVALAWQPLAHAEYHALREGTAARLAKALEAMSALLPPALVAEAVEAAALAAVLGDSQAARDAFRLDDPHPLGRTPAPPPEPEPAPEPVAATEGQEYVRLTCPRCQALGEIEVDFVTQTERARCSRGCGSFTVPEGHPLVGRLAPAT
jgi:hypothetical protein